MNFYKAISLRGIFDWLRQNSEQFNTYYNLKIIMDTAEQEWAMTNYSFLKYHHPEKLQAFSGVKAKLGASQDKEWWAYLNALECSGYFPCNEAVCPMCQLLREKQAAAALAIA